MNHFEKELCTESNIDTMRCIINMNPNRKEDMPDSLLGIYLSAANAIIGESQVVETANMMQISDNIAHYIKFYIDYLGLCNEEAEIIHTRPDYIIQAKLENRMKYTGMAMFSGGPGEYVKYLHWAANSRTTILHLPNCTNTRMKNFLNSLSALMVSHYGNDYYIQLAPATTYKHLDMLYRAICAYY